MDGGGYGHACGETSVLVFGTHIISGVVVQFGGDEGVARTGFGRGALVSIPVASRA